MSGPVLIVDHTGVHLSSLDKAIEEQRAYYAGALELAREKAKRQKEQGK